MPKTKKEQFFKILRHKIVLNFKTNKVHIPNSNSRTIIKLIIYD